MSKVIEALDFTRTAMEIPVEKVIEAIEKNGLEHVRESWHSFDAAGNITGACVLGQAIYNLRIRLDYNTEFVDALNTLGLVPEESRWYIPSRDFSVCTCDSCIEIGAEIKFSWNAVGNSILYWNDEVDEAGVYLLPKYEDVVQMCKDILSPHIGKTITLWS